MICSSITTVHSSRCLEYLQIDSTWTLFLLQPPCSSDNCHLVITPFLVPSSNSSSCPHPIYFVSFNSLGEHTFIPLSQKGFERKEASQILHNRHPTSKHSILFPTSPLSLQSGCNETGRKLRPRKLVPNISRCASLLCIWCSSHA